MATRAMSTVPTSGQLQAGPTPDAIMQLGMGFWGSKALLSDTHVQPLVGPDSMVVAIK
jgi:hypothetical protein